MQVLSESSELKELELELELAWKEKQPAKENEIKKLDELKDIVDASKKCNDDAENEFKQSIPLLKK